ncbi:TetR/AcrR family transcriptional regulator [Frankia sp. AgPm24]|uniref:TetR/AcrR family transcriptional regulator n=1 Tax=Frankia sp. AgPm24 TaxID=631128 RepID=UPI00200D4D78|nr:TetR/AcrR family transcriptional regulator [Frankia sp. AgPm24]MCK9923960.1 TetR/AcrR family transcriptional regulator [Frankia sp. AgPm24]
MRNSTRPATDGSGADAHRPGSTVWWIDRVGVAARRRPRTGGLSTQRIVRAAIEVLDERGFEALTVRAVADRLDTSSGALYQHIASRDELIVLIADHYLGQARLHPGGGTDWRTDVEELMREMRRVLLEAPLPPSASTDRAIWGPGTLRIVDAALGLFLAAGLTNDQAGFATAAIIDFVFGAVAIQRGSGGRGPHGAGDISAFLNTLPPDQYLALRTAGPAFLAASADSVFAQGMALVLDGVASRFFGQR